MILRAADRIQIVLKRVVLKRVKILAFQAHHYNSTLQNSILAAAFSIPMNE
jgi:hypothetical protein